MNKLILALALVLAPFFSFAVESIFEDGTVDVKAPKINTDWINNSGITPESFCTDWNPPNEGTVQNNRVLNESFDSATGVLTFTCAVDIYEGKLTCSNEACSATHVEYTFQRTSKYKKTITLERDELASCPPDNFMSYIYAHRDDDGEIVSCSDPVLIGLVDDCKPESQDYLSRARVTADSVCATLPNHSVCKYDAVDVGAGQKAYVLDLEGDCYFADSDLPESDYVNDALPLPGVGENGYACLADGGLLTCSETPEDVADPDTGELPSGCGTANISFICMSGDTDSDGLPDYLDPDIDGDGILNDDDTDPSGGGGDTGGGTGGDTGGGTGGDTGGGVGDETEDLDLEPVVKKLDEIKKSMSETDVVLIDKPTDKAKSFYESEYEDGLEGIWLDVQSDFQSTEMMAFLNTFKNVPSGSAANGNMCFNLGSMGNFGCGELGANPIIWGAIRIFILVTAGFLCRRLIFGG